MAISNRLIAQSDDDGALPTLYAATFPGLPGGSFVGPDGLFEARGAPRVVGSSGASKDEGDGSAPLVGLRGADRGQLRSRLGRQLLNAKLA